MDDVTEEQCKICSLWPPAERVERRQEHFSTDYLATSANIAKP